MEAVFLIQTNPEDQGFMNVTVYLDLLETSVRLTLMSVNLIHVYEVKMITVVVSSLAFVRTFQKL